MDSDLLVHEEWSSILVPSHHGDGINYRVVFGTVDWNRNGDLKPAIVVFMQKGEEKDWGIAKARGEIVFRMTPHILREDIKAVIDAINLLVKA